MAWQATNNFTLKKINHSKATRGRNLVCLTKSTLVNQTRFVEKKDQINNVHVI